MTKMLKKMVLTTLTSSLMMGVAAVHAQQTITVNGSTTVLPIMQKVSEDFMKANPGVSVALSGGGSGNGIKALIDGLTQVAMSSREIKGNETQLAASRNVAPKAIAVAVDALVPVVNPKNRVKDLTVEQLRNIYKGDITNWKQVGGHDAKIVLVSRDTSSGTYETWEGLVMKKARINPRALLQASNGTVVQTVASNPNAIGYVGIGYLSKTIKPLDIAGVKADATNALSGKWPLARELYLYTNGEPTGHIKKYIDYALDPLLGQKSVAEVGFVPLPRK